MSKQLLSVIFVCLIFLTGCNKNGPTEPTEELSNQVRSVDGQIVLTVSNSSTLPDLDILSFHEEDGVAADNSFDIDVHSSGKPQMVFAVNSNNDLVLGATVLQGTKNIIISESSTANTFILLNPLFMFADDIQIAEIIEKSSTCVSYEKLVKQIAKIINEDPSNVYNTQKYPETLELSTKVGYELLQKYAGIAKSNMAKITNVNIGTTAPTVRISSSNNKNVEFKNQNYVALSAEILSCTESGYEREQLFSMGPKENNSVSFMWGWPPVYITQPKITNIDFSEYKDKSLTIRATKGFDSSEKSNWFKYSTVTGRASILNMLIVSKQIIKFFVGGVVTGAIEKAAEKVRIDLPATEVALARFQKAMANKDRLEVAKAFYDIVYINRIVIGSALVSGAVTVRGWELISKGLKLVKDYVPLLKPISIAYQGATETIPIVTDLIFGARWFDYRIKTDSKGVINYCSTVPEGSPETPLVIAKRQVKGNIFKDLGLFMSTYSDDCIREKLKYYVEVRITKIVGFDQKITYESNFQEIGKIGNETYYFLDEWYGVNAKDIYVKVRAENMDGQKSEWSKEWKAL